MSPNCCKIIFKFSTVQFLNVMYTLVSNKKNIIKTKKIYFFECSMDQWWKVQTISPLSCMTMHEEDKICMPGIFCSGFPPHIREPQALSTNALRFELRFAIYRVIDLLSIWKLLDWSGAAPYLKRLWVFSDIRESKGSPARYWLCCPFLKSISFCYPFVE